jgi:hypothetical protein
MLYQDIKRLVNVLGVVLVAVTAAYAALRAW